MFTGYTILNNILHTPIDRTKEKTVMQSKKRIIFTVCILTYVMAYLCRLNFSSAVLKMAEAFEVTTSVMGTVGSLFFLAYAFGQLINGFIGDRIQPIRFMIFAVVGTGLINLAMTFADSIGIIRFLWVLNGYFQSVFWATCNRLLSQYFESTEHHIISTGMSLSMVISYILSWAVLGELLIDKSWQSYFLIPALSALIMLMIWLILAYTERKMAKDISASQKINFSVWKDSMKKDRLILICIACIFLGIIKEGIGLWAPAIFLSILNGSASQSILSLIMIPIGNLCGVLFTGKLLQKPNANPFQILRGLLVAIIVASLSMALSRWLFPLLALLFVSTISGLIFGCNSILLSYFPLSYTRQNIVAALIGLFDFSAYIGAAISAYVLACFLERGSWEIISIIWALAALCTIVTLSIRFRMIKRNRQET